jgi:hypothetical protein
MTVCVFSFRPFVPDYYLGLFHLSHTILNNRLFSEAKSRRKKHTNTSTMVQELSYTVTSHVMDSWEQVRRMKDYEEVAGAVLFQRCVVI